MKASYVQPRVWCSSREELATILPEFSSPKLVNGISWDLSETPVMLLAEDIPISASNPRGTKSELDITLYRDFVCAEEDLDHEINEYTKRPKVIENAPSFIPSDFSDPGPSRGRRSSAILDPVSPTSNIPTPPDLHTMNMLLSDTVTPGARNTRGHRSLSEPPEILVNCLEHTNMDTDTRHPSNIHTGEQPCSPLPTESSLNDALSPESISARRPRSKDEIDDTIIHCAEYLSVDCDVPRRCPDVSTCPHSAGDLAPKIVQLHLHLAVKMPVPHPPYLRMLVLAQTIALARASDSIPVAGVTSAPTYTV
ncbi:hypothetical protein BDQ17DRAFT_314378 [Cyathus striatus]|nr:hypothetical protein BDQ17DRAFT_314378 [Cyathus striatus]